MKTAWPGGRGQGNRPARADPVSVAARPFGGRPPGCGLRFVRGPGCAGRRKDSPERLASGEWVAWPPRSGRSTADGAGGGAAGRSSKCPRRAGRRPSPRAEARATARLPCGPGIPVPPYFRSLWPQHRTRQGHFKGPQYLYLRASQASGGVRPGGRVRGHFAGRKSFRGWETAGFLLESAQFLLLSSYFLAVFNEY